MSGKRWLFLCSLLAVLSMAFSACGSQNGQSTNGTIIVKLFFHSGQGPERSALNATLNAFNAANQNIKVKAVELPTGSYNQQVNAAALARQLPCLLDFDGPNLYNYAWSSYLIPLEKYVSASMKADFLPSIIQQGTYNGHLYSLGQFDSGLSFYAKKKDLQEAGVRIPTINRPWTLDELNSALARLKKLPGIQYPLNLSMSVPGEWYTYAFSPFLQSFGGDLINRQTYQTATGVLNGSDAVAAMTWFQELFKQGYVNVKPAITDDFIAGNAALSWGGHWNYPDYKALGTNLLLLPAPDLGKGARTGMGSWNWGITSSCANPDAAWKVLNFILSPGEIKRMTDANGAVPARKSVIANAPLYAPHGPLRVFVEQLENGIAVPRPATPAYPAITTAFATAIANISVGANVQSELNSATQAIDQNIKDNNGYPIK